MPNRQGFRIGTFTLQFCATLTPCPSPSRGISLPHDNAVYRPPWRATDITHPSFQRDRRGAEAPGSMCDARLAGCPSPRTRASYAEPGPSCPGSALYRMTMRFIGPPGGRLKSRLRGVPPGGGRRRRWIRPRRRPAVGSCDATSVARSAPPRWGHPVEEAGG